MMSRRGSAWIAAAALAVLAGGCKREEPIDGVAGFSLERTTLSDAPGICTDDGELTWCHSNGGVAIANQRATVDLYFRGERDDAPLVEILLAIDACRPASVEGLLSEQLGDPDRRDGSLLRWNGSYAVTFAQLNTGRGGCEINIVSPDDAERIAALSGKGDGGSADSAAEATGAEESGAESP